MGASTYSLVRTVIDVETVEPLTLKGKAEPVPVYRVVGLKSITAGPERSLDSPMVGRDTELTLLRNAFERTVTDKACHMFTILGPAGVGKSRLASELLRAAGEATTAVRGRCLPYGEGITFWPLVEIVKDKAGILDGDSSEQARGKLLALMGVAGAADDAELVGNIVAQVVGLLDPTATREEIFWAVRKFFEALAHGGPLIVIFDDIHWAETLFLDLIEYIANSSKDAPILLLCMARQDLLEVRPAWGGGKANASSILLEALNEEATVALLENLLGQAQLSPAVHSRILEASGGNPFFVEEMVSMLIDQGLLRKESGHWIPTTSLSSITVPPTIQALLAARLDRLIKEERQVVERASIVGKVFTTPGVTGLSPEPFRPHVRTHLGSLERKEFVVQDTGVQAGGLASSDETFKFRHILIRDAAYNSLPKEARAELHEKFADWLTEFLGDRATEQEEILGYHLEQAYNHRAELGLIQAQHKELGYRAAERLASAGRKATRRGDEHAAVNLLSRAVALFGDGHQRRLELLPELGIALMDSGDFETAEQIFAEAIEGAKASANEGVEAHARIQRWLLLQQTDLEASSDEAIEEARRAIDVFNRLGDEIGLSTAWHLEAYSHTTMGRSLEAEQALERSIEHAQKAGNHLAEAASRRSLIVTMLFGPTAVGDLIQRCEDNLAWARSSGDLITEARALGALGQARAMQGDFAEARELILKEKRILEELGSKLRVAWTAFEASAVELLSGDPERAEKELLAAYDFLEQIGEKATLSTFAAILAEAKLLQDDQDEADRLTLVSQETATEDDFLSQMAWRSTRAKVLAKRGEFDDAERLAKQAIEIAARTDFVDSHANVMMDLAAVLEAMGRLEDAGSAAGEALELFSRKGNVVGVDRAAALIARLDAATAALS